MRTEMDYVPGSSDTETTAADAFVSRQGVCRDYAHLLASFARAAGIPARLVSAYAWRLEPPDFHAVVEVWLDGGWHLVDPTGLAPIEGMARIAVGRDATDIAFMTIFGEAADAQPERPGDEAGRVSAAGPTAPLMLDAQNAVAAPAAVRREDYRPPDWLVPEIALEFELDAERTIVRATLEVDAQRRARARRCGSTATGSTPVSRAGRRRAGRHGAMDGGDLVIDLAGDRRRDRDRHRDRAARQHQADGPLRIRRHPLHPVRGRGLPADHLLPRPARRAVAATG